MSRYSTQDLASIVGSEATSRKRRERKTSHSEPASPKAPREVDTPTFVSDDEGEERSHGFITVNGGSIQDYFAKKLATIKRTKGVGPDPADDKLSVGTDDHRSERQVKKKKRKKEKDLDCTSDMGTPEEIQESGDTAAEVTEKDVGAGPTDDKSSMGADCLEPESQAKKKKRRKKDPNDAREVGTAEDNPENGVAVAEVTEKDAGADPTDDRLSMVADRLEPESQAKKKKKRRKKDLDATGDTNTREDNQESGDAKVEVTATEKRETNTDPPAKKKKRVSEVTEASVQKKKFEETAKDDEVEEDREQRTRKKKCKKSRTPRKKVNGSTLGFHGANLLQFKGYGNK